MVATIVAIGSVVLSILALWALARQLCKELPITAKELLLGLFASVLMLAVNLLPMRRALRGLAVPVGLAVGLAFGLAWGLASRFVTRDGGVYVRRSALHLIFWGVSCALTQALAWFAPTGWIVAGLTGTAFAAGTTIGMNLNHMFRYALAVRQLRRTTR